jgi:hypothetical protein
MTPVVLRPPNRIAEQCEKQKMPLGDLINQCQEHLLLSCVYADIEGGVEHRILERLQLRSLMIPQSGGTRLHHGRNELRIIDDPSNGEAFHFFLKLKQSHREGLEPIVTALGQLRS